MTQEQKELLLTDLCARLPYGTICEDIYGNSGILFELAPELNSVTLKISELGSTWTTDINKVKPYLRPMSSMTEEEKKELLILLVGEDSISYFKVENDGITNTGENIQFGYNWQYYWLNFSNENMSLYVDWLNSHHFDYRGLIPMGLAIKVTEKNNPYKD